MNMDEFIAEMGSWDMLADLDRTIEPPHDIVYDPWMNDILFNLPEFNQKPPIPLAFEQAVVDMQIHSPSDPLAQVVPQIEYPALPEIEQPQLPLRMHIGSTKYTLMNILNAHCVSHGNSATCVFKNKGEVPFHELFNGERDYSLLEETTKLIRQLLEPVTPAEVADDYSYIVSLLGKISLNRFQTPVLQIHQASWHAEVVKNCTVSGTIDNYLGFLRLCLEADLCLEAHKPAVAQLLDDYAQNPGKYQCKNANGASVRNSKKRRGLGTTAQTGKQARLTTYMYNNDTD